MGQTQGKTISFFELSNLEQAKKMKINPGYYFIVDSVTPQENKNYVPLVESLTPKFYWALATLACTRTDVLPAGASYPAVTITVNVATNAPERLFRDLQQEN